MQVRAIKGINMHKAPNKDGISTEIFVFGGSSFPFVVYQLICDSWRRGVAPKDL